MDLSPHPAAGATATLKPRRYIDRATGICASIHTNARPFVDHDTAWKLYGDFEEALYAPL